MRWVAATALVAALAGPLLVAPSARSDDGEDNSSTLDLHIRRPDRHSLAGDWGWWPEWWYANRTAILRPSWRVGSEGKPAPEDPAARSRARDALLAALGSKMEIVSSEAALALGRAGDPRDIATLANIVRDTNIRHTRRTHRYAALGLGTLPIGDAAQAAEARTALVGALENAIGKNDDFTFFWENCAWALGMRGDVAALPALIDLRTRGLAGANMRSTLHSDVLGALCYPLARLAGEDALPEILEHLNGRRAKDGGSKENEHQACHGLAQLRGEAVRKALREAATGDYHEMKRSCACQALGVVSDAADDATAAVLRTVIVKDDTSTVRQMAEISLGRMAHATSVPVLLEALDKVQKPDRPFIVLGLAFCARAKPDPRIERAFVKRLDEENEEQELMSLCLGAGIANLRSAKARVLAIATENASPLVRSQAFSALAMLGGGVEEQRVLRKALAPHGDYLLRREAALALGFLHDREAVDQLRAIVASESEGEIDRQISAVCLGRIGDDTDIDFLVRVMTTRALSDQTRACVIHALGFLLDRTQGAALGRVAADSLWAQSKQGGQTEEPIFDLQHLID